VVLQVVLRRAEHHLWGRRRGRGRSAIEKTILKKAELVQLAEDYGTFLEGGQAKFGRDRLEPRRTGEPGAAPVQNVEGA